MRPYVLSVALALLSLASTPATAAALAPSKPSQLVAVTALGTCPLGFTTALFDTLVKGDGTTAPFSIPAGEVLVITDLTVVVDGKTPGDTIDAGVFAGTSASSRSLIFFENITAGPSGAVTLSATFPTGIVVKSGTSLCPIARDNTGGSGTPAVFAGGSLHGFLTKDK
jgi:hypothetical protein